MKIKQALEILQLKKLPVSKEEIDTAYKVRAKELHPDVGGSEEAFQSLTEAYELALRGLDVVLDAVKIDPVEEALKKKRAAMREEMLKRRAGRSPEKCTGYEMDILHPYGSWNRGFGHFCQALHQYIHGRTQPY